MKRYRIDFIEGNRMVAYVAAESASAAEQCFIDYEFDECYEEDDDTHLVQVREVVRVEIVDGLKFDRFANDPVTCASCGYELVDERCVNQLCIQYRTHPEESE